MKLEFGKFKGYDLEDVPLHYLEWLTENHDDDEVRKAAEDEIACRRDHYKGRFK